MLLTVRALALLVLGGLLLAAATFWPPALLWAAVYVAAVLGLLLADVALSPQPWHFALGRRCDSKLSLAVENPIQLDLRNNSKHPVSVAVRDEFPAGFETDRWQLAGRLPAGGELTLTYHLRPLRRGDYQFGDLNLRYRGLLGLIVRQERYPAAAAVRVYPNLRELRRYALLAGRGRLAEIGLRHTRLLGRGTEFERLREYEPDDDYRRISWKATARRGRPITVEYETERSQNVMLVLDAGRLMAAPIGPLAKLDYAVNAALMLAYVATRLGDNVGLLAFADQICAHLPPRRGKRQFLATIEALYKLPAQLTESDHDLAFRYLATHCRKRSLIVLFTDLIDADSSRPLVSHIGALSPHHLPVCVTISDPGITRLATLAPSDSSSVYQRAVAEELLAERRTALEALRRRGAPALDVSAEHLTADVINKYLELKARGRL